MYSFQFHCSTSYRKFYSLFSVFTVLYVLLYCTYVLTVLNSTCSNCFRTLHNINDERLQSSDEQLMYAFMTDHLDRLLSNFSREEKKRAQSQVHMPAGHGNCQQILWVSGTTKIERNKAKQVSNSTLSLKLRIYLNWCHEIYHFEVENFFSYP